VSDELERTWKENRSLGSDLNLGPPKYEAEVLTSRPQRPVVKVLKVHANINDFFT
jgi:hypothetical protein